MIQKVVGPVTNLIVSFQTKLILNRLKNLKLLIGNFIMEVHMLEKSQNIREKLKNQRKYLNVSSAQNNSFPLVDWIGTSRNMQILISAQIVMKSL